MLNVVTCLWDANEHSFPFSRCYDESWVTRLCAGFDRHLTRPFRFVLFTDRRRDLPADIVQKQLSTTKPDYGHFVEPYQLDAAMILVGLDTVVTGPLDHLADYCLRADMIALPRDPYAPHWACNGVALVPAGQRRVFDRWSGENDMEWMRAQPHVMIDDLFAGQIVSYKGRVRDHGLGDARIVYFHGVPKMHDLEDVEWVRRHWKGAP